jgi:hypothetical protein
MPAWDYERGRFVIRDLPAVHVATGVVYGVADADVTDLRYMAGPGLAIRGRTVAERDVTLPGTVTYCHLLPVVWGQVAAAFEAGAEVVPAGGGRSAGPPEGAVSEGGIP